MSDNSEQAVPVPLTLCPRCHIPLSTMNVRTTIWRENRLFLVEDIPALVCERCSEQFYDDDVSDAIRQLSDLGFPDSEVDRMIEVPVFSLAPRVRVRVPLPEDTYVD